MLEAYNTIGQVCNNSSRAKATFSVNFKPFYLIKIKKGNVFIDNKLLIAHVL